jgi:hypothetical protein
MRERVWEQREEGGREEGKQGRMGVKRGMTRVSEKKIN